MADKIIRVDITRPVVVTAPISSKSVVLPTIYNKQIVQTVIGKTAEIFSNFNTDVIFSGQDLSYPAGGHIARIDVLKTISDVMKHAFMKVPPGENAYTNDSLKTNVNSVLNDTAFASDVLIPRVTWKRTFSDSVTTSESFIFLRLFGVVDTTLSTDFDIFNIIKIANDTSSSAHLRPAFSLSSPKSDIVISSEIVSKSFNKFIVSDDYFSEIYLVSNTDYVGSSELKVSDSITIINSNYFVYSENYLENLSYVGEVYVN